MLPDYKKWPAYVQSGNQAYISYNETRSKIRQHSSGGDSLPISLQPFFSGLPTPQDPSIRIASYADDLTIDLQQLVINPVASNQQTCINQIEAWFTFNTTW